MEQDDANRHLNTDQFIAMMQRDEVEDAPYITPIDYAKIRPFSPQQIYYHIRAGHITARRCPCGRKVIDKAEADAYFIKVGKLQPKEAKDEGSD